MDLKDIFFCQWDIFSNFRLLFGFDEFHTQMRRFSRSGHSIIRGFASVPSQGRVIGVAPCLVAGTVAGGIGAVIGVGGGIISSPILRVLGMEGKNGRRKDFFFFFFFFFFIFFKASASCLPMVLFSAGVGAFSWHLNAPPGVGPDVLGALLIGSTAVVASPLGVKLSVILPAKIVSHAMGLVLLGMGVYSGWVYWDEFKSNKEKEPVDSPDGPAKTIGLTETNDRIAILTVLGFAAGLIGGAFGVGGGILIVPVLVNDCFFFFSVVFLRKEMLEQIDRFCNSNCDESRFYFGPKLRAKRKGKSNSL